MLARVQRTYVEYAKRLGKLKAAVRQILECIGEDPDREGLVSTPERYAKAILHFNKGYKGNITDVVNDAFFAEDQDERVIVRDIEIYAYFPYIA